VVREPECTKYKQRLRELFSLEKRGKELSTTISWVVIETTEPESSSGCTVIGQEATDTNCSMGHSRYMGF